MKKAKLLLIILCVSISVGILLKVFNKNISFFLRPREVYLSVADLHNKTIRIGGVIRKNSLQLKDDKFFFIIDDVFDENREKVNEGFPIEIYFSGTLPSLFKEGQMTVVRGVILTTNPMSFEVSEVLAKHDEKYYPKK